MKKSLKKTLIYFIVATTINNVKILPISQTKILASANPLNNTLRVMQGNKNNFYEKTNKYSTNPSGLKEIIKAQNFISLNLKKEKLKTKSTLSISTPMKKKIMLIETTSAEKTIEKTSMEKKIMPIKTTSAKKKEKISKFKTLNLNYFKAVEKPLEKTNNSSSKIKFIPKKNSISPSKTPSTQTKIPSRPSLSTDASIKITPTENSKKIKKSKIPVRRPKSCEEKNNKKLTTNNEMISAHRSSSCGANNKKIVANGSSSYKGKFSEFKTPKKNTKNLVSKNNFVTLNFNSPVSSIKKLKNNNEPIVKSISQISSPLKDPEILEFLSAEEFYKNPDNLLKEFKFTCEKVSIPLKIKSEESKTENLALSSESIAENLSKGQKEEILQTEEPIIEDLAESKGFEEKILQTEEPIAEIISLSEEELSEFEEPLLDYFNSQTSSSDDLLKIDGNDFLINILNKKIEK
ncbi:MAG: hypothetical protein LBT82_03730 [Oscillospiraceae bacterium]|jgi:hypothetical protein|nr:hypothetical protein [Oscillospiraceae bacterium]